MNRDLKLALELADAADAITMQHYRSATLAVRTKIDLTPVSEADEAVERMIRERLAVERPDDGILGEEFGTSGSTTRRWIVDPIDGTKNYVRGIPVFATLIGVEENGRVIAGVVSAPALARRWWASAGEGAFCNGQPIHASRIDTIEESHLTYDSIADFDRHGGTVRFLALMRRCVRARGFGDFWAHMLVAEGAAELAVDAPDLAVWDAAPLAIILEEAGGRYESSVSWNGVLDVSELR